MIRHYCGIRVMALKTLKMGSNMARPRTKNLNRRAAVTAGIVGLRAPDVLRVIPASTQSRAIVMGHVSQRTGPRAGFGEADSFILDQVRALTSKGLQTGGKTYPVQIISKDSQSSGSRA